MNSRKALVLIVDNSDAILKYNLLPKSVEIRPHFVRNCAEALQAIASMDFDLVVMDWILPDCDGLEAQPLIRRALSEHQANVPVICVTARAMIGDRERCLTAGMDDYLAKPFTLDQLTTLLNKWLPVAPNPMSREPYSQIISYGVAHAHVSQ